jgi:cell division protein FtsQ
VRDTLRSWVRAVQRRVRGDGGPRRLPSARVRFEQRAHAARRRPWVLVGTAVAILTLMGGLGWVVWASPVLVVDEVVVTGLDGADRDAALTAAAVPIGEPLARVDSAAVAQRVGSLPIVKRAVVTRSWPRTLVVSVTARVGMLVVRNSEGTLQVVDEDGVAFRDVDQAPAGLAVVNGSGQRPAPEGLQAVIEVLRILPADQRATVSAITVSSASMVTFALGEVGQHPRTTWPSSRSSASAAAASTPSTA